MMVWTDRTGQHGVEGQDSMMVWTDRTGHHDGVEGCRTGHREPKLVAP